MATPKTIRVGPFFGINNRRPEYRLGVTGRDGKRAGDYLSNAVNVDLTEVGTLRRRRGAEIAIAGSDTHSLWGDAITAMYVDGTTLYRLAGNPVARTVVKAGLAIGLPCSFARMGQDVYWTNGVALERVSTDGSSGLAGVPVPNPAPDVEVLTGGSLPEGVYQIAVTAVRADGEQSGSTWPIQVQVPANGGLRITNISGGGFLANVYLSPPNGDQLFRIATLPSNVGSMTIPVMPQLGERCLTMGLRQMPAGHICRAFNGRLLIAAGDTLFYSEPYAPALHNPLRGYIQFPSRISICEPCDNGVYVVADQTYWLSGTDIEQTEVVPVLPYGAIEGTGGANPFDRSVRWFSRRGLVIGQPDGQIANLQEKDVAVGAAGSGASLYRDHDGMRQILSSLFGVEPPTAAVSTWMEAELGRKENML